MNTPVVLKNTWWEWALSVCVGAGGVVATMFAMTLRGRPFAAYSFNKAAGLTAMLLVLSVIVIGCLYRTNLLPGLIRVRRPLAIIAVVLMCFHASFSLFVFPNRYDWNYYAGKWEALLLGLAALLGFLLLWLTSYDIMHRRMGRTAWKKLQNGVYVMLTLAFLHVCYTGKPVCWLGWLEGRPEQTCARHSWVPPLSFALFVCVVVVVVLRLIEPVFRRRTNGENGSELSVE